MAVKNHSRLIILAIPLGLLSLAHMLAIVALEICGSSGSSVGALMRSVEVQIGHILSSVSQTGPGINRLLSPLNAYLL